MDFSMTLPLERRPFSAPPAATIHMPRLVEPGPMPVDDPRRDPGYYNYYQANRALNPRLAPPLYDPFPPVMSAVPMSSPAIPLMSQQESIEGRRPRQDSTIVPGESSSASAPNDSLRNLAMDAEPLAMPTPTTGAYDTRGASTEGSYPITGGGSRSRTPVMDGEEAVRAAMAGLVLEGAPRSAPHGSDFGVRDNRAGHAFPLTQQIPVDRSWADYGRPEYRAPPGPGMMPGAYEGGYTISMMPPPVDYRVPQHGAWPGARNMPPAMHPHDSRYAPPPQHYEMMPSYDYSRGPPPQVDPRWGPGGSGRPPMDRRAGPPGVPHDRFPPQARQPEYYAPEENGSDRWAGGPAGGRPPRDRDRFRGGKPPQAQYNDRPMPSKSSGSVVLEGYLHHRMKITHISQISGHMATFARDGRGHLVLLDALQEGTPEEKDAIVAELIPSSLELMTDQYGSSVIQCVFERGSYDNKMTMAGVLRDQVLNLSLHHFGCRVVQKALEYLQPEHKNMIAHELVGHLMKCVQDQNGNHVVQKCIEQIKGPGVDFIIDAFVENVSKLSMHPYGCRVIQRILEHGAPQHVLIVLAEVMKDIDTLIQHQYGNYVVQCVLEHGKPEHKSAIIDSVSGRLLAYARHKFASNVVERCMEYGSATQKASLVEEILAPTIAIVEAQPDKKLPDEYSKHITPLQILLADQFGNYVAQKLLDIADDRQRVIMIDLLRSYAPTLRKYQHGRHMLARMEKVAAKFLLNNKPDRSTPVSDGTGASPLGPGGSPGSSHSPATLFVPSVRAGSRPTPPSGFLSGSTPSPLYGMSSDPQQNPAYLVQYR